MPAADVRRLAVAEADVLNLVGQLSLHLTAEMRDARGWEGLNELGSGILRAITTTFPATPRAVQTYLATTGVSEDELLARAFSVLDAVDNLVGLKAHPSRPPRDSSGPFVDAYNRLRRQGRYNDVSRDRVAVIPSQPTGTPDSRRRIGRYLCFVKPIQGARVFYLDLGLPPAPDDSSLAVAFFPVPSGPLQAGHEEVRPPANPTVAHYRIRHRFDNTEREAIDLSLKDMCAQCSDVSWAIFPEASLDDVGFSRLATVFSGLSTTVPSSSLKLLTVGVWTEEPSATGSRNAVRVLVAGGSLRDWIQPKINSYDLDLRSKDGAIYGLAPGRIYFEWLDVGNDPLVVVGDTPFGRALVAICEDAAHINPSKQIVVDAQVDYFVVPVLDEELKAGRWYHQAAQQVARESGAVTVVATSAFLERRRRLDADSNPITVALVSAHQWAAPDPDRRTARWLPGGRLWSLIESVPRELDR